MNETFIKEMDFLKKYLPSELKISQEKQVKDNCFLNISFLGSDVWISDFSLIKPRHTAFGSKDLEKEIKSELNGEQLTPSVAQGHLKKLSEKFVSIKKECDSANYNTDVATQARSWLSLNNNLDSTSGIHLIFGDEFSTFSPRVSAYAYSLLSEGRKTGGIPEVSPQKLDERSALIRFFSPKKNQELATKKASRLFKQLTAMLQIEKNLKKEVKNNEFPAMETFADEKDSDAKYQASLKEFMEKNKNKDAKNSHNYQYSSVKVKKSILEAYECARYLASLEAVAPRARLIDNIDNNTLAMQNIDKNGGKTTMFAKLDSRLKKLSASRVKLDDVEHSSTRDKLGRGGNDDKKKNSVVKIASRQSSGR